MPSEKILELIASGSIATGAIVAVIVLIHFIKGVFQANQAAAEKREERALQIVTENTKGYMTLSGVLDRMQQEMEAHTKAREVELAMQAQSRELEMKTLLAALDRPRR